MNVLVVVGDAEPPPALVARADHVLRVDRDDAQLVAHVRAHVPRRVSVTGAGPAVAAVALKLQRAGLPVVVHTDDAATDARFDELRVIPIMESAPPLHAAGSLLDLVGNTPLVRLDRIGRHLDCHLLAKLELLNPGGSVKDRPAIAMVDAAERAGLLQPGGTIVEPTSGNTGVGLAIVAARRKYRCVFVMPDKMSQEKILLLRAYGAEVVVCPTTVAPDHPDSYYSVAARLAAEIPGAFQPNQYANPANPYAHEHSTGPEIWHQTSGRVTHFVAGIGTGGTITGVARYLKAKNPGVRIVGADPEGSVYSGGSGRPYLVEGIGEDFWPETYDPSMVDEVVMVSDADSFLTARRVTREEGILVGGSTGTAVSAALHVAGGLGPDSVVVVLVPDSGRGYLSKVYNDDWMADFGFLKARGPNAGDMLDRKTGATPQIVHVEPTQTVRVAIELLREHGISQLPVIKATPPFAAAEVVGSLRDRDLMGRAFDDAGVLDRPVSEIMGPPLPTVGIGEGVDVVVRRLDDAAAVVVLDAGHPLGVLSRADLLDWFSSRRPS